MPILDATSLNGEDVDILRGVLGPAARPPIHAEEMRRAAHRADQIANAARKCPDALLGAIRNSQRAPETLVRRLHSSA
jgi:hypothetical protein